MRLNSSLKRILIFLNLLLSLMLLGACYIAFYPISLLPFLDTIGILIPALVVGNLIFLLIWLFIRRQYGIIPTVPLLFSFLCFGSIYNWHSSNGDSVDQGLSIVTYNVQEFNLYRGKETAEKNIEQIMSIVEEQNPDIVCFQESIPIDAFKLEQYPYQYRRPYNQRRQEVVQAIYSKYPIINSNSLNFPNSSNNTIYVDIVYAKDTIRVYNVHLQSYRIGSFRSMIKRNFGIYFLRRLNFTSKKHREQVAILNTYRKSSPYPSIICGDFNQTQYSPSYRKLQKGMSDSFKEKGQGWGTTFMRNIISARIDFILADEKAFEVLEHRNYDLRLSDHLPIMARLKYLSD